MTGRRIAAVKGVVLLAAAAATTNPVVTALCVFLLARLAGRTWDNQR